MVHLFVSVAQIRGIDVSAITTYRFNAEYAVRINSGQWFIEHSIIVTKQHHNSKNNVYARQMQIVYEIQFAKHSNWCRCLTQLKLYWIYNRKKKWKISGVITTVEFFFAKLFFLFFILFLGTSFNKICRLFMPVTREFGMKKRFLVFMMCHYSLI